MITNVLPPFLWFTVYMCQILGLARYYKTEGFLHLSHNQGEQ